MMSHGFTPPDTHNLALHLTTMEQWAGFVGAWAAQGDRSDPVAGLPPRDRMALVKAFDKQARSGSWTVLRRSSPDSHACLDLTTGVRRLRSASPATGAPSSSGPSRSSTCPGVSTPSSPSPAFFPGSSDLRTYGYLRLEPESS